MDQAALDYAIEQGIPHGGFVPLDRKSEAGPIPAKYQMTELPFPAYPPRTEANIHASDATAIFVSGLLNNEPGCLLTAKLCMQAKKPYVVISLVDDEAIGIRALRELLVGVKVLNVAGPRGSHHPDMAKVKRILAGAIV